MNPALLIWPMILVALVTLALLPMLFTKRVGAVRSGKAKVSDFKVSMSDPEESILYANAFRNQTETPTLFYAVCLAAYVTNNSDLIMIALAWVYAIIKLIHVYIHVTGNSLGIRVRFFAASVATLFAMWVLLAINLLGQV